MNIEELRLYCIQKFLTSEEFPFDDKVLAFKVSNKIFALTNVEQIPGSVNLKCDPEKAIELRQKYPDVIMPGYHMNKKHWNTIFYEDLSDQLMKELIDHSYDLVVSGLTKRKREELGL